MRAGGDDGCSQHIIDAGNGQLLVERAVGTGEIELPTIRIVDFGEDCYTILLVLRAVFEAVGCIMGQLNKVGVVGYQRRCFGNGGIQRPQKGTIDHCRRMQILGAESGNLIVGIAHTLDAIHKPTVAHGIRVGDRNLLPALQRHDGVFHIEHIQHGEKAVAVARSLETISLLNGRHERLHLGRYMDINQILIAAELGCRIAADRLEVVARARLVEGVGGEIQHTEMGGILEQLLLVRQLGKSLLDVLLRTEIAIVAEAFVDRPHIGHDKNRERKTQIEIEVLAGLEIAAIGVGEDHQKADCHETKRTPCVGTNQSGTLVEDGIINLLSDLRLPLSIVGRGHIDTAAQERHQRTYSRRDTACNEQAIAHTTPRKMAVGNGLERHKTEQRHGDFRHDKNTLDGTELIINREIAEEEFGQRHEMMPPCKRDREKSGDKQRPLVGAIDQQQRQQEQEADNGTHIDGPAGERLLAPIGGR